MSTDEFQQIWKAYDVKLEKSLRLNLRLLQEVQSQKARSVLRSFIASRVIGMTLSWREWAAVIGVVAGVGLLGSSAGAQGASQVGAVFKLALIVAVAGLAVVGLAAAKLNDPYRTTALGITAGFGFGVLSIAARVLNGFSPLELARDPAAYAIAAAGIISFMFYATALEGGSVTVATAAVVLSETIPPAVIGVVFLGDQTRPGLAGVAWAGFVIAIASAVISTLPGFMSQWIKPASCACASPQAVAMAVCKIVATTAARSPE